MAYKMGILGRKLGMTRIFANDGASIPVTVLQAGPCTVTQVKTTGHDGYNAIQLGFGEINEKHVTKPMRGHFRAHAGKAIYPDDEEKQRQVLFAKVKEIRLTDEPTQKLGDVLKTDIFSIGEVVKVTGTSIGKGFQGRMRRWGFAGSKDTHGCEKVHRNNGSIGNNTFPGHVFKGRKMAGHWGAETVTQLSLQVVEIRPDDNVILVRGTVPGPDNGLVIVRKQ